MKKIRSRCITLLVIWFLVLLASPNSGLTYAQGEYILYFPVLFDTTGPVWIGPEGGSVVALAGDPHNGNILYAGTYGAGVFKSVDGGEHWSFASQGIAEQKIDSIAVHPSNGNIVYAGTHGGGVYKTINGGVNWYPVNNGIQYQAVVYTMTVNPGNPDLIYAGTRGIVAQGGPPWNGVLYKSTNGGASWQAVLENIGGAEAEDWVYSVRANPSYPNMVLAASHEHGLYLADNYGGPGDWQPVGNVDGSGRAVEFDPRGWTETAYYGTWHRTGIYRSLNGGYDWQQSSTGLGEAKIYPNGISISSLDPDIVYLASFADSIHGVMRSASGGASWARAGLESFYIYSVYAPKGQANTVIAGTANQNGIYKSTNGGASWTKKIAGLTHVNASGVAFVPPSTLYASTKDTGVMRSTDNGQTWSEWNAGLGDRQVLGLVQSPADANRIFALTATAGLRRLDAQSGTWVASSGFSGAPGSETQQEWIESAPDRQLVEEMLGPLSQPSLVQGSLPAPVLSMSFAPSNPNIVYAGTGGAGLFTSTDGGINWTQVAWNGRRVQAVVVHPTDPNHIYIAADGGASFMGSPDGGRNWWFERFLPEGSIQALALSPNDPSTVYIAGTTGLWKHTGSAITRAALDGQNVLSVAYNPNNPSQIYAGTTTGAYFVAAGGGSLAHPEIAGYAVSNIAFNRGEKSSVYLSTTTRGILRAPVP